MADYQLTQQGPTVQQAINKALEIQGLLDQETAARQAADALLATKTELQQETARAEAAEALLATISSLQAEIDRATGAEGSLQTLIDAIAAKIPAAASSSNQLADKSFVNSSIATSTATFRGTYSSLSALEAVTADENDYGYVTSTDSAGNTLYSRYKYASGNWVFEYALNNSSFTAAEWAAIQSGITSALVSKLSSLPENSALQEALSSKYVKPSTGIPKADLASGIQTSLNKADSSLQSNAIADNLTTDDATKVLSAKQGVVLAGQVSQLGQIVDDLSETKQVEQEITYAGDTTYPGRAISSAGYIWEMPSRTVHCQFFADQTTIKYIKAGDSNDTIMYAMGGTAGNPTDKTVIISATGTGTYTLPAGARLYWVVENDHQDLNHVYIQTTWKVAKNFVEEEDLNEWNYPVPIVRAGDTKLAYYGPKISVPRVYNIWLRTLSGFTSGATQGFAVIDKYGFSLLDGGQCKVYDVSGELLTLVGSFNLGSYGQSYNHCNSAQFGVEKASGGMFPLLYVAGCFTPKCFVENITLSGSTLVQTITINVTKPNIAAINVQMGDDGYIWAFGGADTNQPIMSFIKFRQVTLSEGDVTLTDADILDYWTLRLPYEDYVWQGGKIYDGKLFFTFGGSAEGAKRGFWVIDLANHSIENTVFLDSVISEEVEDMDVFDGYLILAPYLSTNLYKIIP